MDGLPTLHRMKICSPLWNSTVTVTCSAGTYIRALARDLGEELRLRGGHLLTMLRRTRVGRFSANMPNGHERPR